MTEAAKHNEDTTPQPEAESAAPMDAGTDALRAELADAKDKMLRALADAENVRKRAERAQIDASKFAVAGFARDLLDVADNLRRAIDSVPAAQRTDAIENLLQGVEATERAMLSAFEKNGIRKIAPAAGTFDPNIHEVMFEAEVPGKKQGEIIQLVECGYMLHERLLRPARVGVAKGDPNIPAAHSLDQSV
ncbi:MAG: nucleotide exchange factor GrpE [Rhodospirillales bacterium]|nr:nucleotide exchange factor GrpE [Alphaproteobacteria bacterium]MCB9987209.1 nucleotide exchange factor GrpE [Rhodospirillales bacterium]USO07929.1 MAG: nucleotide exchange factor GrpE [Rhodospirillales bacterium]